jgi:hypothetical protein
MVLPYLALYIMHLLNNIQPFPYSR